MSDIALPPPAKGPSAAIQAAILVLMTGAAIGMGWVSGAYLKKADEPKPVTAASAAGHGAKPSGGHGKEEPQGIPTLVALAPITTNLAAPSDVWVRLEAAIVFDTKQPPELAEQIHQDLLALLRTTKLHQIEGASGYQHLRADLKERAELRSGGHATDVLIRTLLLE